MTDVSTPLKVLMELRPCLEGYAGIPQETRLLFSAFQSLPDLQVDGLINHPLHKTSRALKRGRRYDRDDIHRRYGVLSKYIVSQLSRPEGVAARLMPMTRRWRSATLTMSRWIGRSLPLDEFDGSEFKDFIWESLFSKSLGLADFDGVCNAGFRTLQHSWRDLHLARLRGLSVGLLGSYPRIDTRGYDIFLAQTPYPARVAAGTQMLVRYHDAIPMLLPQRISTMKLHRAMHYRALCDNAPHAVFACTSAAVREDLLRMFPALEHRTPVVPDVVSDQYFPETPAPATLVETIRHRINERSEPVALRGTARSNAFYQRHLDEKTLRYVLIVCTLEPRKNHVRLVRAWERLRQTMPQLKLVVVGEFGWEYEPILDVFRPWQERGQLFHLSRVPPADLRALYSGAACVVCPSVAEGFDLSGVEAQLCGTAVAASDIAVHREVYGDAACYFDPYSVAAMADSIRSMIDADPENERPAIAERAVRNARQYRREAIAPRWEALFGQIRSGQFKRADLR